MTPLGVLYGERAQISLYLYYVYTHIILILEQEEIMPNMTLAIPADLKQKMDQFKEINWSEVARQAIRQKEAVLEKMDQLLAGSKLDEMDIEKHSSTIKKQVHKKHIE